MVADAPWEWLQETRAGSRARREGVATMATEAYGAAKLSIESLTLEPQHGSAARVAVNGVLRGSRDQPMGYAAGAMDKAIGDRGVRLEGGSAASCGAALDTALFGGWLREVAAERTASLGSCQR